MNRNRDSGAYGPDPLGLRQLPPLEPPADDWPVIAAALGHNNNSRLRAGKPMVWLAAAALLLLAVGVVTRIPLPAREETPPVVDGTVATLDGPIASDVSEQTLDRLIAMSQTLENRVRKLSDNAGPMPGEAAVYLAELQDLVAQVDNELSFSPDSVNLWSQRVNLLLDLTVLYQTEWEREHGRIAQL